MTFPTSRPIHALLGIFAIPACIFSISGCAYLQNPPPAPKQAPMAFEICDPATTPHRGVLEASYVTADCLARIMTIKRMSRQDPILTASFVNIDDLTQSSTLGRMMAEQVASRLSQRGFSLKEVKLRHESIYVREKQGEFLLSRNLKALDGSQDVRAVLVGTYALSGPYVLLSARIVSTEDNTVLASHDCQLVMDRMVRSLLK